LGIGELSTLALAREIAADVVFLDHLKARKLAIEFGFAVRGTVGLLESFYRRGDIDDLRAVFGRLIASGAYIHSALLNSRLEALGLRPL
jgi:predicted nucleic acid-binding protein